MAGDKESTLVFKVDGTQAETGVAKVKRSLNDLADTASREGQRGAAGIAGMGAGAEKSAAQIERSTQRQIGEIRRMTAELESGGKATRAYQEAMASIRGVDASALRPYLDQLEQARTKMGQVGMTAGQMSNALRTVPMQFTDIVTSLASGQNAFTVFIQQGGQLKDMFGGVGNAEHAVGQKGNQRQGQATGDERLHSGASLIVQKTRKSTLPAAYHQTCRLSRRFPAL